MFVAEVGLIQPLVSVCFVVHYVTFGIKVILEGVSSVGHFVKFMTRMESSNAVITIAVPRSFWNGKPNGLAS